MTWTPVREISSRANSSHACHCFAHTWGVGVASYIFIIHTHVPPPAIYLSCAHMYKVIIKLYNCTSFLKIITNHTCSPPVVATLPTSSSAQSCQARAKHCSKGICHSQKGKCLARSDLEALQKKPPRSEPLD